MSDKKTEETKNQALEITLTEEGKKPKKEKNPLDKAARKKRRRIAAVIVLAIAAGALVVKNRMGGEGPQAYVSTTQSLVGEIEQTINTSGTVTTEKTKSYFSDVNVKIESVSVAAR